MSSSPSSTDGKVDENQTPAESVPAPEPDWLKLDPTKLQESIRTLRSENQDFLRQFNTEVGNVAARKYQPEIERRDREIDNYRKQLRKFEIQAMDASDIEKQIASDADFAAEWAELIHFKPSAIEEDPTPLILEAYDETVNAALSRGVSQDFIDKATEKAAQGGYTVANEPWQSALRRFENDLTNEALRVAKGDGTTPPVVNSSLLKGGPDASGSRRGSSGGFKAEFTTAQGFKALPAARRAEIIADPEGKKYVEEIASKG